MAGSNTRTLEDVRRDIESQREQLADAADSLRESFGRLRSNLPAVAAGALGVGFLLAGGVGATARLIFRRGRESGTKAKLGRFRLVDRD